MFKEDWESQNLSKPQEGIFQYNDRFSSLIYKKIKTIDDIELNKYALFTAKNKDDKHKFSAIVSNDYKFMSTENLVKIINNTSSEIGKPVLKEQFSLNTKCTKIRVDLIIQNEKNIPNIGTFYPCICVSNSYDGTAAAEVTFGISYQTSNSIFLTTTFMRIGKMREIHMLRSVGHAVAFGEFIESFNTSIENLISVNMNSKINEADMLKLVEWLDQKLGQRRRQRITSDAPNLENLNKWSMFMCILRYTAVEKNLNARIELENAAERILEFPAKAFDVANYVNDKLKK